MPTYLYQCPACGWGEDIKHGFHETYSGMCRSCGDAMLRKAFHAPAVSFKGGGWGGNHPSDLGE